MESGKNPVSSRQYLTNSNAKSKSQGPGGIEPYASAAGPKRKHNFLTNKDEVDTVKVAEYANGDLGAYSRGDQSDTARSIIRDLQPSFDDSQPINLDIHSLNSPGMRQSFKDKETAEAKNNPMSGKTP